VAPDVRGAGAFVWRAQPHLELLLKRALELVRRVKDYRHMSHVTYMVVEHDGGWAYKVGDVFSETFATRAEAHTAAARAAQEQRAPGEGGPIDYEDSGGRWHGEQERGDDRPETDVKD
jgi:hypothetical protein